MHSPLQVHLLLVTYYNNYKDRWHSPPIVSTLILSPYISFVNLAQVHIVPLFVLFLHISRSNFSFPYCSHTGQLAYLLLILSPYISFVNLAQVHIVPLFVLFLHISRSNFSFPYCSHTGQLAYLLISIFSIIS